MSVAQSAFAQADISSAQNSSTLAVDKDADIKKCKINVRRRIKRAWAPTPNHAQFPCKFSFVVDIRGNVSQIKNLSGENAIVNATAKNAIEGNADESTLAKQVDFDPEALQKVKDKFMLGCRLVPSGFTRRGKS